LIEREVFPCNTRDHIQIKADGQFTLLPTDHLLHTGL